MAIDETSDLSTPIVDKIEKKDRKNKEKKKKRLLGFAGIIFTQLNPLNESTYFKENYGMDNYDLLLIASDDKRAALVHFKEGTVVIEQVKNKPEEINPVKKQVKNRIETDIETFMNFAMGKVNPVKAIITGKLKIKGIKKILRFTKYFKVLAHMEKEKQVKQENQTKQTA